jgi:hypothetical protein
MEPLNDDQLNEFLREWKAPGAPDYLEARIFQRPAWWKWLLTGSIRVPVPAVLGLLIVLAGIVWAMHKPAAANNGIADFQPVKELKPRVIRSTYHEAH